MTLKDKHIILGITGWLLNVDNVSGVINSFPAGVITTCTSAPFFTNPRMI